MGVTDPRNKIFYMGCHPQSPPNPKLLGRIQKRTGETREAIEKAVQDVLSGDSKHK